MSSGAGGDGAAPGLPQQPPPPARAGARPSAKNETNCNKNNAAIIEIPITVNRAGKLGVSIMRCTNGSVRITAVSESALDGCRDLRPGDLLAMPPASSTSAAPAAGAAARTYYGFEQFKSCCSTGIRPLRFTAVRVVLPIQLNQPGPLGFAVEEYVPGNGNAKQVFTRVVSVDTSQSTDTSQSSSLSKSVQVGDFICYPGSRGSVSIPRDLFVNTLSSCRPLCFDVIRPGIGTPDNTSKTTGGTKNKSKNTTAAGRPSAKLPVGQDGRSTSSAVTAPRPAPKIIDRTNDDASSMSGAPKKKQPEQASIPGGCIAGTNSKKSSKKSIEVIDLLDSDSDGEELTSNGTNTTAGTTTWSSSFVTLSSASSARRPERHLAGPARTGTATHHQPGTMRFPPAIDTLFNGNEASNRIPPAARGMKTMSHRYVSGRMTAVHTASTLTEIRNIQRSTNKIADLKFIWPMETPVPEASGGFYEVLSKPTAAGQHAAKKAKSGKGKKTYSRIGRLAGTVRIPINVASDYVRDAISNKDRTFFLAEDLLSAEEHGQFLRRSIMDGPKSILEAIVALNDRDNPFKERCLYAVGESLALPKIPSSGDSPIFVDLTLYVYFRRSIFGLSATPAIKVVLDALQPMPSSHGRFAWVPCRKVPASSGTFNRSPRPEGANFDHTLPGLLWANESTGYDVSAVNMPQYEGAKVTLRDYQKETVHWMRRQEDISGSSGGGVPGLNGFFWERRTFGDQSGDVYYYFPLGGHVLLNPPPVVSGGLLAEEMGLGKTVEIIELICSDAASRSRSSMIIHGGTLVVLPVSLLSQWKEEMKTKAPHLTVEVYNGDNAKSYEQYQRAGAKTVRDLSTFDVVLTTMGKLQELSRRRANGTMNILDKVSWHRLVVDECQYLKNDTSVLAKNTSAVDAKHVWMLSGTPLTNKLDDLRGELSLLRVWPFTLGTSSDSGWTNFFWEGHVKEPWDAKDFDCLDVVHSLMSAVAIRHSRLQTRSTDGSPLVELPPRTECFVKVQEPADSHETYINRWLEATAASLLERFGRVDVRVFAQIMQLRIVASSGALLSLERVNEAQKLLARQDLQASGGAVDEFRQLSVRSAILEFKRNSHLSEVILQELTWLQNGTPLSLCTYCRGPRTKPVYLACDHSICSSCCKSLVGPNGSLNCPSCKMECLAENVIEVISNKNVARALVDGSANEMTFDLTESTTEKIDALLKSTEEGKSAAIEVIDDEDSDCDSTTITLEPSVQYMDDTTDFSQKDTKSSHTLESLESFPTPNISLPPYLVAEFPSVPEALAKHVFACQEHRSRKSAKIQAIVDEIRKIRSKSLEAKICVFSSFAGSLNELEDALSTISFEVLMETSGRRKLDVGSKVTELATGRRGVVQRGYDTWSTWDSQYQVSFEGARGVSVLSRSDVALEPARFNHVPSRNIRGAGKSASRLSVNGSNERYDVGDAVQCTRPFAPSAELRCGYSVNIEVRNGNTITLMTGKITAVHQTDDGDVSYDVNVDRGNNEKKVPPSRLQDMGDSSFRPAVIQNILSCGDIVNEGKDPYADAIGYVRLDGSAGDAELRGEKLNVFRNDPMCSVALLTKRAAGVGLNLTNANYAIVVEPSEDAHDEIQSVCRVHRIGQTRTVKVLKFFVAGTIEERILKRRQQRGELSVSINALAGGTADEEDDFAGGDASKSKNSEAPQNDGSPEASVSASKVLTFDDLKLLLGRD